MKRKRSKRKDSENFPFFQVEEASLDDNLESKQNLLFQFTKSIKNLHTASWNPKSFTNKEYPLQGAQKYMPQFLLNFSGHKYPRSLKYKHMLCQTCDSRSPGQLRSSRLFSLLLSVRTSTQPYDQHIMCHHYELSFNGLMNKQ